MTFDGTLSFILVAAVPGRGENGKTWIFAKPAQVARAMVCWKSRSVSPGKPTMMSAVIAGRSRRSLSIEIFSYNSLEVYCLAIRRRTSSEADWMDRWMWGTMFWWLSNTSSRFSVMSAGSSEPSRIRGRSGIPAISWSSSANLGFCRFGQQFLRVVFWPNEPRLTPVRTISLCPVRTKARASDNNSVTVPL